MVASGVDDAAGFRERKKGGSGVSFGEGETGIAEVGVGFVQAEAAAGGESESFVEVLAGSGELVRVDVEGGVGEEAEREVVLLTGAAEAVNGLLEVGGSLGEVAVGASLEGEQVCTAAR